MEAEVLERINRGIIMRTGGYLTNDHFVISSDRHAREYVEKRLVTTETAFTEGLGDIIAKHYAASPVDVVLASGIGATILGHCVARAHPSRPKLLYAVKGKVREGKTEVMLPREFLPFLFAGCSTLIVEDILTTGSTVRALMQLVDERKGRVVGIGSLWNRNRTVKFACPFFALVTQDFPTYPRDDCPLCRKRVPVNTEYGMLVGRAPRRGRGARRSES
ncbi:MAG: phosphoribosyltransferase family protein [candidate division NC10 bacterium]|nr:phosphoribosyltransferase family protein [candidate division NC10 bacterium]